MARDPCQPPPPPRHSCIFSLLSFSLFLPPLISPFCFLPTRLLIPHFPLSPSGSLYPLRLLPPSPFFRSVRHRGTNYGGYIGRGRHFVRSFTRTQRTYIRTYAHAKMDISPSTASALGSIIATLFIQATGPAEPCLTVRVSPRRKPRVFSLTLAPFPARLCLFLPLLQPFFFLFRPESNIELQVSR